jgi:HEPN domain-containing protein
MLDNGSDLDNNIPPELEVALVFLRKAQQDLVAVKKWLTDFDISDEIIGFHIQQAIEKSLKAILLRQSVDYPHTHNLRLLLDLCHGSGIEIPTEFLKVDVFNRFAVQWRYDLLPSTMPSALDREAAYDLAHHVWRWANEFVMGLPQ